MHMREHELGFIDFSKLGKQAGGALTRAQGLADQVIAGKQLFDRTRQAFRQPSAFWRPPPVQQTAAPIATGQRFEPASTQTQLPAHSLNNDQIRRIQNALKRRGFNPGPIDGIYGPLTKAAIESYQASAGFVANGIPTAGLLRNLEIDDEVIVTAPRPKTSFPPHSETPRAAPPPRAPMFGNNLMLPLALGAGVLLIVMASAGRR